MDQQVWDGILDSERLVRYFLHRAERLRLTHLILTALLFTATSGAVAAALIQFPTVSAGVMIGVAALSAWLYLADYAGKAEAARLLHLQFRDIATEWRRLWYSAGLEGQDAVDELRRRETAIVSWCHVPVSQRLNEKCAGEAYETIRSEFQSA